MTGVHVIAPRDCETITYGKLSKGRIEKELKGTAKAHAATRRMKEYQVRAAEKGTKRTKGRPGRRMATA